MEEDLRRRLFGTTEAVPAPRRLAAGPLAVEIADGAVRAIAWNGTEVLRGIDYPIRDADWGTYGQTTIAETQDGDDERFVYRRHFSAADGAIEGRFVLEGDRTGVVAARLVLTPRRSLRVCRAGFVVLHPIAGVAGTPLQIVHGDGAVERTRFPELIAPAQPVFDIAGLTQTANGVVARIAFSGEIFEMEDQRNWSDASYKTYCRPLAWTYPYEIGPGQPVEQTVRVTLSGAGRAGGADGVAALALGARAGEMPEVTLSLEEGWDATGPALDALAMPATRIRLDATAADWRARFARLAGAARGAVDLELVLPDEKAALDGTLAAIARQAEALGIAPRRVAALPMAYLKSYQPDGQWPGGTTPEAALVRARTHFPRSKVMGGMLTNFTELNRYRGAAAAGDVLTHGTTAIVHAADDRSVIQTLEALPQIFKSAAALAPRKPYHLGLVAIGMRSNPYGSGLAANPERIRKPMADADPRQEGLFAAAFMVGAVAATQHSAVSGLSLAAPSGPMGVIGSEGVRPAYHVLRALARLSGAERIAVSLPEGLAGVAARTPEGVALIVANLTPEPRTIPLPAPGAVLMLAQPAPDHDWLERGARAEAAALAFVPYGVAFVSLDSSALEQTP